MNIAASRATTDIAALTPPPAINAIAGIIDGYKNFQALRAGYRSGLFDWLQQQSDGAERAAIGEALNLRGAHLAAFLQSLEDLGLLKRDGMRYQLATDAASVLCADSLWCRAHSVDELQQAGNGWSDLHRFMAQDWVQGEAAPTSPALAPYLGEVRRLMTTLQDKEASRTALANARSLVCFDGSGGLLGVALAQRYPHLAIAVVVPEVQFTTAANLLRESGFLDADNRSICKGTVLESAAAGPFDYAIVFHALYPVRKTTDNALAQLSSLLSVDAGVCLAHWFCLEACDTAPGGLRDLDKAVLTDSHPLCGIERFGQRLEQAGMEFVGRCDLSGEYGATKLHFARKQA